MKKEFKMLKDFLEVTITHDDKVILPGEGQQEEVGTYTQKTVQLIQRDKANLLLEFVEGEIVGADKKIAELEAALKPLKDLDETKISEEVIAACQKVIGKGTKILKQKMLVLNTHLEEINRKKAIKSQLEYWAEKIEPARLELEELRKVCN